MTVRELIQELLQNVTDLEKPVYFEAFIPEEDRVLGSTKSSREYEVNDIIEKKHRVVIDLW